ncbi:MAG: hypothetical protein KDA41_21840 [Planctomycetales bacterium]|nr:hypothetical protein [Planctomycetales bacterium]
MLTESDWEGDLIYIGADRDVVLSGFRIRADGTYLNAATATWSLKNASLAEQATGSLAYVASSNGNYLGCIDAVVTAALAENALYAVDVAAAEDGYDDFRRLVCKAVYRRHV